MEPATQAMKEKAKAVPGTQGVMPASSAPNRLAMNTPIHQLGQLKLWLMAGAAGGSLSLRDTRCCTAMQNCTTSTRKKTMKAFLWS